MKLLITLGAFCPLACVPADATVSADYQFTGGSSTSSDADPLSTARNFILNGYGTGTEFENGSVIFAGDGPDIAVADKSTAISDGRYA